MGNKMMMIAASVMVLFAAAMTVSAHHSFSAEFDGSKTVTLEGKVFKMDFVNPHSWLYIDAVMPDGNASERCGRSGLYSAVHNGPLAMDVVFELGNHELLITDYAFDKIAD